MNNSLNRSATSVDQFQAVAIVRIKYSVCGKIKNVDPNKLVGELDEKLDHCYNPDRELNQITIDCENDCSDLISINEPAFEEVKQGVRYQRSSYLPTNAPVSVGNRFNQLSDS